jgi:hypothetical protein
MSTETNKAIVRRLFDEVWNTGNVGLLDELGLLRQLDAGPGEK